MIASLHLALWLRASLPGFIGLAWLITLGDVAPARAAEGARHRHRHLVVIETSGATAPHRSNLVAWAGRAMETGLGGWMQPGDPIRVWALEDRVQRDIVPLEEWSAGEADRIARQLSVELARRTFRGTPPLPAAVPDILRGAGEGEKVTIILVTDGRQPLRGTPFDRFIDAAYQAQSRPNGRPLVTRLVLSSGEVTAWDVTPITPDPDGAGSEPLSPAPSGTGAEVSGTPSTGASGTTSPATPVVPLPPAPTLAPELVAPLSVAPLVLDEDSAGAGGKEASRRPLVVAQVAPDPAPVPEPAPAATGPVPLAGAVTNTGALAAVVATNPPPNAAPATSPPQAPAPPRASESMERREPAVDGSSSAVAGTNETARIEPLREKTAPAAGGIGGGRLLIGLALLATAAGLIWRVQRARRPRPEGSLISRSMGPPRR